MKVANLWLFFLTDGVAATPTPPAAIEIDHSGGYPFRRAQIEARSFHLHARMGRVSVQTSTAPTFRGFKSATQLPRTRSAAAATAHATPIAVKTALLHASAQGGSQGGATATLTAATRLASVNVAATSDAQPTGLHVRSRLGIVTARAVVNVPADDIDIEFEELLLLMETGVL